MKINGTIIVIPSLISVLAGLLACGGPKYSDTYDRIMAQKVMRIGTDATYPPFETMNVESGELVGFDIDLMTSICNQLGVKPDFIVTPFDGIIPGLLDDKYDIIISSMTITPKRAEKVAFTNPYYWASQTIAVRMNEENIKRKEDLYGRRLGAQLGTTGEMLAKRIPNAEVFSFDNIGAAFIDLANGKVDAVINDKPTSEKIIAIRGDAKIVGDPLTSEQYGMAVRKEDLRLLDKINSVLAELESSGAAERISEKWFK
ncbi:MAG: basic amino acid ABC transporter substrate-binding protein [candidate division Zixibacteria bacterium CG_4_9_14_3_um_filter_46_8]|nr:MAG: basic amino acid ABC transporter substrate-binding protein [candidate division Zixibacteria bacterium CG_4_9_14_3_um_filter_46_8]